MRAIEVAETGGPPEDASTAHRDLEGRRTVGSNLLTP